jgi:rubrerythrin
MQASTESAWTFVTKAVVKAIQSEEIAAAHYLRLAAIAPDESLACRAVADARDEERHAEALRKAARRDGIVLREPERWDDDSRGLRVAYETCAQRGDVAACMFIQDVLLEIVAITHYEILAQTATRIGALSVAALVSKAIVPDERLHLAHGLQDIARRIPGRAARAQAFHRAAAEVVPALRVFSDLPADEPCAVTCGTCEGRCLKLDACCGGVSLGAAWGQIVTGIADATRRAGIGEVFVAA